MTAEGDLIRIARLRKRIKEKKDEHVRVGMQLKRLKTEHDRLERNARNEFARRHAADGDEAVLPDDVSVRPRTTWEYDEAAMLELALAEGIEQVIKRVAPSLRKTEFNKMLDDGLVEFDGVKRTQVPTVYIREAAILRAYAQGLECDLRGIDIDTGEVIGDE